MDAYREPFPVEASLTFDLLIFDDVRGFFSAFDPRGVSRRHGNGLPRAQRRVSYMLTVTWAPARILAGAPPWVGGIFRALGEGYAGGAGGKGLF